MVLIAEDLGMDAAKTARHLSWSIEKVHAALAYAAANAEEIDAIVEEVRATTLGQVQAVVPWARQAGR